MSAGEMRDGGRFEASDVTTGRWPNWAIGLAMLALVLIVLGGAFVLNARLRPKVGIEPVATSANSVSATTVSNSTPIASRASGPASATAVGSTAASPSESGAAVVGQAYLHYWDVYNQAVLDLETSHLSDVMGGDALNGARQYVDQLRSENHALVSDITHHYNVTSLSDDTATVDDDFVDGSYLIDRTTKQRIGTPEPKSTESIACQLKRINGVWKVVSVVRVAVTVVHQ